MATRLLAALRHLVATADPTIPTPQSGMEYFNSTTSVKRVHNGTAWLYANEFAVPFTIQGVLSVGVTGRKQRIYNRSGSPWVLVGLNLYINTGPVGADASLQVNKNGSSAATITVTGGTNNANTSPALTIADGDFLDFDITAVGSTVAGSDATLTLCLAS